ncbi:MAG: DUF2383 domain-containing protein [Myxococcales bacterium]
MAATNIDTVNHLNSFLRGELSAVEAYRQAIKKLPSHQAILQACEQSHSTRVSELSDEIRPRGGTPAQTSGLWGQFAMAVEGTATALGEKTAIAVLEEGEDHGRDDYRRDMKDLDIEARQLVETRLLPEQKRTHDAISALKKRLS